MNLKSHGRSLVKALTWRILGSVDTFVLGFLFTGKVGIAASVASAELFTKLFLYYLHERLWRWLWFDTY